MSFLANCPECGVMRAKDYPCPECNYSDSSETSPAHFGPPTGRADIGAEFSRRMAAHNRNCVIHMMLSLVLGLSGLITAGLWLLVIYRGSILAMLLVGVFSVISAVMTWIVTQSGKFFPRTLHCPGCEARIDQMGRISDQCPFCNAQLKGIAPSPETLTADEAETNEALQDQPQGQETQEPQPV